MHTELHLVLGGRGSRRGGTFSGLSDGSSISASALNWDLTGEGLVYTP